MDVVFLSSFQTPTNRLGVRNSVALGAHKCKLSSIRPNLQTCYLQTNYAILQFGVKASWVLSVNHVQHLWLVARLYIMIFVVAGLA